MLIADIELSKTPPPKKAEGTHGPTPSLIDIAKLFQIPEQELHKVPSPPSILLAPEEVR